MLLIIFLTGLILPVKGQDVSRTLSEGIDLYNSQRFGEAIVKFDEVIRIVPNNSGAWMHKPEIRRVPLTGEISDPMLPRKASTRGSSCPYPKPTQVVR